MCAAVVLFLVHRSRTAVGLQADPDHPVLAIGAPAPDFSLPGIDGKTHSLADYAGAKVLAVVFACDHCPASQQYEGRIEAIARDYRSKGVALVAINPFNPKSLRYDELSHTDVGESLADMKVRAASRHLDYPYLSDGETQAASARFGAVGTPQIFIFDGARHLSYEGRIDDNPREDLVRVRDARRAIDALLAGQSVPVARTSVEGCGTKWVRTVDTGAAAEQAAIDAEPVEVSMAGPAELKALRGNGTKNLLLINFWATWCGPCVSEFSDLQDTYRMYRSRPFGLVTVSENQPEEKAAVLAFLDKKHASSRNLLFATPDTYGLQEAFDPMMGSAVPFTVLVAPNGDVLYQELGSLDMMKVRRAILANLPDDGQHPGQRAYWSAD